MALFGKRKEQPAEVFKIDFEGQEPVAEMDFRHEHENILEALTLQEQGKSRWRTIAGSVMMMILGAMAMPTIYAFSRWWAGFTVVLGALLVTQSLFGGRLTRTYNAQKIAEAEKDITRHLKIYPTGIAVEEGGQEYCLPYRPMRMYESERQFTVLIGTQKMLAFPKKEMGEKLALFRKVFRTNLGKRFFTVDNKGKVIDNE